MTWLRVLNAVLELCDGRGRLVAHTEKPWWSATFNGVRHELLLSFEGEEATLIGEALIAELPGIEFSLPGQIVVEARVEWARRQTDPQRLDCQLMLLLLDEERAAA
ncbi:MAG: hypothetical protein WCZ28_11320 [Burkholderiaceae bacterium]